ncbi:MAG: ERF family protein [Hungatella hathewayi]|uniref:ERF family protein n=1 Tax=Hungatella hathewayi TaxID=154046 RepID=UPI0039955A55
MEKRGETKQLSLQQKVVQIRKRIPALVKKAYSEEVSYDFVKIDDVYRHLAPAMNDYQVNLEVISESATRKDEQGNPLFVQYVPQCQMWMYEADLTLRWINAEEAQEADTVVIHAIGSHEFPDKAKGSAWTYALKYYLLNKFCIDQGGEDPDMRGLKTPETEAERNGRPNLDTQFSSDETESSDISELEAPEADSTDMSELEPPESKLIVKPRAEKKARKIPQNRSEARNRRHVRRKKQKRLESLGQQRRGSRHRGGARKRSH